MHPEGTIRSPCHYCHKSLSAVVKIDLNKLPTTSYSSIYCLLLEGQLNRIIATQVDDILATGSTSFNNLTHLLE